MVKGNRIDESLVEAILGAASLVIMHNARFDGALSSPGCPCSKRKPGRAHLPRYPGILRFAVWIRDDIGGKRLPMYRRERIQRLCRYVASPLAGMIGLGRE
jgi:hypothetical protein